MEYITNEQAEEELKKGYSYAKEILNDEDKLAKILLKLENKLKAIPKVGEKLSHIPIFASLVNSYVKKEYTQVPLGTVIAIVSAIVYFVSPIDLIPDIIPGVGLIDDAAVVTACVALVESDIREYIEWRDNYKLPL